MLENLVTKPRHPYFLSHSIGLIPKQARRRFDDLFFDPWQAADSTAWDHWLQTLEQFKRVLGEIINADKNDICPQANVSSALTKILFSLPKAANKSKILLSEADFPTIGFVLQQAEKIGLELQFLPKDAPLADPETWTKSISDDTYLVHITHAFSNLAVRTPVPEIVRRAKQAGAFTIVDAAQSVGTLDVDVRQWNADFVVGTAIKYLCGGPGASFLWANPDILPHAHPIDTGWFSHASPFEFNIHNFDPAENASRFLGGSPSIAPLTLAISGLEMIRDAGVRAIETHNQMLIDTVIAAFPAEIFRSHITRGERGSHIMLKPRDLARAEENLKEAQCAYDQRKDGIRLSVHGYTTQAEIAALIEALTPAV